MLLASVEFIEVCLPDQAEPRLRRLCRPWEQASCTCEGAGRPQ